MVWPSSQAWQLSPKLKGKNSSLRTTINEIKTLIIKQTRKCTRTKEPIITLRIRRWSWFLRWFHQTVLCK